MIQISPNFYRDTVELRCDVGTAEQLAMVCEAAAHAPVGRVDEGWQGSAAALRAASAMARAGRPGSGGGDYEWQSVVEGDGVLTSMDPGVAEELASELVSAVAAHLLPYDWMDVSQQLRGAAEDVGGV